MMKKIIFIVGPTAVGKSDAAFCLARHIGGEIISCDSMQVYREINIASNKPPQDVLDAIPHHLVNILSVEEEFDAARFRRLALAAVEEIHGRDRIPVITGGSGMYMQILLDGIFEGRFRNGALRDDLKKQAGQWGNHFLYDKLKVMDPRAAEKIHPNDSRRIIRALEICITEKRPASEIRKNREGLWGKHGLSLFALDRKREELYARIDERAERMFAGGLIGEMERLKDARWSRTAKKIIGVREVQGLLRGEYNLAEAKALMKLNTRRLAKRQWTWFRKDKRIEWLMTDPADTPEKIVGIIMERWKPATVKTGCA